MNNRQLAFSLQNFGKPEEYHHEKDFTFIINDFEYHLWTIIAEFLSPGLRHLRNLDPTICFLNISIPIFNKSSKSNKEKFSENFIQDIMDSLVNCFFGQSIDLDQSKSFFLCQLGYELQNDILVSTSMNCYNIEDPNDAIQILRLKSSTKADCTTEVNVIASNFSNINHSLLFSAGLSAIQVVLSSRSLQIESESEILNFIIFCMMGDESQELTKHDQILRAMEYSVLLRYLFAEHLQPSDIKRLLSLSRYDFLHQPIFECLNHRLLFHPTLMSTNPLLSKIRHRNPIKKYFKFDSQHPFEGILHFLKNHRSYFSSHLGIIDNDSSLNNHVHLQIQLNRCQIIAEGISIKIEGQMNSNLLFEGSENNLKWVQIHTIVNSSNETQTYEFSPVGPFKYIRILSHEMGSIEYHAWEITQIEFFGTLIQNHSIDSSLYELENIEKSSSELESFLKSSVKQNSNIRKELQKTQNEVITLRTKVEELIEEKNEISRMNQLHIEQIQQILKNSVTLQCTNSPIKLNLPSGVYQFECYGAQGQNGKVRRGGYGGYTKGIVEIKETTTFFAFVGSQTSGFGTNADSKSIKGGGASDIRLTLDLKSRIMVAGGGGGGCSYDNSGIAGRDVEAGRTAGGGLNGQRTTRESDGGCGTQTCGGSGHASNNWGGGTPGTFGSSGIANSTDSGCGGGGYYGGGGAEPTSSYNDGVGGGGSSFISGFNGCNAINENGEHTNQSNHYSGLIFKEALMESGKNAGNGKIVISYLPSSSITE